ncbi:aldo/keto reductase [Micromonospora sp. URMC 103]|uniref:aldo/keto reductase n=1 Tax=Micromonospora sp. URMC 103 TaxID=3423406 RepID=UPI003F19C0D4
MTRHGLGCAQLGNLYTALSDAQAADTVAAAWESGVRYFDTAPHYGLGLSERRLGEALRARPRGSYTVSTKVGRLLVPDPAGATGRDPAGFDVPADHRRVWDFSADGVRRSLEASLDRLGLDRVDVVLVHDPEDHQRQALEQAYPALHELRTQGVVGAVGVGSMRWQVLHRFVTDTDVDAVMVAGRYTLAEQPALDTLLPECERRGVSVLNAGVFNSGLLAVDQPGAGATYDYHEAPAPLLHRVRAIAAVCARHGTSLPAAALAFAGAHPAVAALVVGAHDRRQVRRNVALHEAAPPPADLWSELVAEGLLRPDAPVPAGPSAAP